MGVKMMTHNESFHRIANASGELGYAENDNSQQ